jgi:hypothetical protein
MEWSTMFSNTNKKMKKGENKESKEEYAPWNE